MAGLATASRGVVWASLLLTPLLALHAVEWQVRDAALRYKVDLDRKPTHASAGYFVQLPDGGLLQGAPPSTIVMTEDGKVLPSFLLWHNAETGFSIVFADPGDQNRPVYVYTQAGGQAKLWAPASGLTPSTLLCSNPGRDSIKLAQDLAQLGSVEADVHVENKAGIPRAPLSIGGDDSGRPRPASFYLLAYLEAFEAGKYWVAPMVQEGLNEIQIDGTRINPNAHSKAWGGIGAFVDLNKGLHRVEIYQTEVPAGPPIPPHGLMYLTWRPPKEQFKEVESRIVRENEIVRSGAAKVVAVEARDKTPVAAANATASLVYWFENEEPLVLYNLHALTADEPAGTTYTWTFPEGATLEGEKVGWIFPGLRNIKVKLTATSGANTSTVVVPFFSFGTGQTSLDNPKHRAFFRDTVAAMLAAYPKAPDPVTTWSDAWWSNLTRTIEGGEGEAVLRRLFTDHFETVRHKVSPDKLYALEGIFLDFIQRTDPKDALAWVQKFATSAEDSTRQNELKLRGCEIQIYYLNDRKAAEATLTMMAGQFNPFGERAKIRLGDLAFLAGDLNTATKLYADVQNRARTQRNLAGPPRSASSTPRLRRRRPSAKSRAPSARSRRSRSLKTSRP